MAPAPEAAADRTATPAHAKTVHVLWMTAGLGCDGESVAMTSATSPSPSWRGAAADAPVAPNWRRSR